MKYLTPGGSRFSLYTTMLNQSHLLVAGATGSGKSVLMNSLISTALLDSPGKARLILLDPKMTELFQWEHLPHTIRYSYEQDEMIKSLRETIDIMENRLRHLRTMGERLWTGAQIYVVIDELADMLTTNKVEVAPLLQRIMQLGRAAGIHVIAGTQCLLASVLPTPIKVNFPAVVCLRVATKQQSRFICDKTGAEQFPDPKTTGKALGYFRTGADIKQFEVYRVPDEEQKRLVSWWTGPESVIG